MTRAVRDAPTLLFIPVALLALARIAAAAEPPKELVPKAPCSNGSCHADFAKKKHVHGPIAAGECKACHKWKDNKHDFTLADEGPKLCTGCHEEMIVKKPKDGEKNKLVVHEPITEDCTTCHTAHAGDTKALLSMPVLEMCEACHDETFEKIKAKTVVTRHSVVLKGRACLSCHVPHKSKFAKLLANSQRTTCLSCHDKPVKAGTRTIPSVKDQMKKKHLHGPFEDEDCTECHAPHASQQVRLLARAYPRKFYAPFAAKAYALCLECHDEEIVSMAKVEDETEFRNGTLNLHFRHVNKKVKGRTCRACHASHASDQACQIRRSVPFGTSGWSIPIRFKKTDTGGTCDSGCHAPRSYDRETPVKYGLGPPPAKGSAGQETPPGRAAEAP